MAAPASWKLPERIIALSEASTWSEAIKEWSPNGIEKLEEDEYGKCLCDHYPIRELCYVINNKNGNRAIVGNHCIEKFIGDHSVNIAFKSVPKIFKAINRIYVNVNASANNELLHEALRTGVLSAVDVTFYSDIQRKRNLTPRQGAYKRNLNRRLVYAIATSAGASFAIIKANHIRSANPRLLKCALEKSVITKANYDFYMQIWMRMHSTLSDKQKTYKINLNDKIIANLGSCFDSEHASAASSASGQIFTTRRIDVEEEET